MLAVVQSIESLASSATSSVEFPVPLGARALEVHLAASSPVTGVVQLTRDGSAYVNASVPELSASAGNDGAVVLSFDGPYATDAGPIVGVKLALTNGASSNIVAVFSEEKRELGY